GGRKSRKATPLDVCRRMPLTALVFTRHSRCQRLKRSSETLPRRSKSAAALSTGTMAWIWPPNPSFEYVRSVNSCSSPLTRPGSHDETCRVTDVPSSRARLARAQSAVPYAARNAGVRRKQAERTGASQGHACMLQSDGVNRLLTRERAEHPRQN